MCKLTNNLSMHVKPRGISNTVLKMRHILSMVRFVIFSYCYS